MTVSTKEWFKVFDLNLKVSVRVYCFSDSFAVATVDIMSIPVDEPSSSGNVAVATLTLGTSSGGTLEAEVVVEVTAIPGTASELLSSQFALILLSILYNLSS